MKLDHMKKMGADKIALLGLFALGLILARIIISQRVKVALTGPIKLPHTNLFVSLPTGSGWQSEKQWSRIENGFHLSSFFARGNRLVTSVECAYLLAEPETEPERLFEQRASRNKAAIAKTGRIRSRQPADALVFDWARMTDRRKRLDVFLAVCRLPDGRQLSIKLQQFSDDIELAEKILRKVVGSIKFQMDKRLDAGAQIVTQIKTDGLDQSLPAATEDIYLIQSPANEPIGFTITTLTNAGKDTGEPNAAEATIKAADYLYIRGPLQRERLALFEGNGNLGRFNFKSESRDNTGQRGIETTYGKNGAMAVKVAGDTRLKLYQPGPAAIPELFLNVVLNKVIETGCEEIIIDLIGPAGQITPVLISRLNTENTILGEEDAYVFRLVLLDNRGFSQQIHLDEQKRISKALLNQEVTYLFERTTAEDILKLFPERAKYIFNKNAFIEKSP